MSKVELGQQEAQQGLLLVRALPADGVAGWVMSSAMLPSLPDQLAKHRSEFVEGAPEVEVGPHLAKAQENAPIGAMASPSSPMAGPRESSPARRDPRSPRAGSPKQGVPITAARCWLEQRAAQSYHADQNGQQHEEDPRPTSPDSSQR